MVYCLFCPMHSNSETSVGSNCVRYTSPCWASLLCYYIPFSRIRTINSAFCLICVYLGDLNPLLNHWVCMNVLVLQWESAYVSKMDWGFDTFATFFRWIIHLPSCIAYASSRELYVLQRVVSWCWYSAASFFFELGHGALSMCVAHQAHRIGCSYDMTSSIKHHTLETWIN